MTMAAAIAELSVGGVAQAASGDESSRSNEIRSSAVHDQEPLYRVLDGTSFEMFRLLGKGRSIKDIAFYHSISPAEVDRRLDLIREQTGCKTRTALVRMASAWMKQHEPT